MTDVNVPVLIVGGGGCGLSSSIFLSDLGVEHILIERHQSTSNLPKAHYLNQRTMEIFRQHRLAEAIYALGAPMDKLGRIRWMTSLGGDGPLDGKTFHEMDGFGGGSLAEAYDRDSPCPSSNLPQLRLEPLLRQHAEERAGPGLIRFGHELATVEQDDGGVTAEVVELATGNRFTIRARYLIGADGGKTVGALVGVPMQGVTDFLDLVSMHFSADLSPYWDDRYLITFFSNPDGGAGWGSGAMAQMGPSWGSKAEEYNIVFGFLPDDPARFDEDSIVPKVRELLKLPDLDVTCHRINHWIVEAVLAERYRVGRVFLAGDAAHRHPPTTGLGLNTAFQDAHNLAWKLARVLGGSAADTLLDTYEAERRPVGARNVQWAMFTFMNHGVLAAAVGVPPGAPPEVARQVFAEFLSDSPMGATRRTRFAEVAATQRTEFQAHDLEIGFSYPVGAFVHDGSAPVPADPMGCLYRPTTRPGHRLPHAWIERDGVRLSTHDLVGRSGGFALLTGPDAGPWQDVAGRIRADVGLQLTVVPIGPGAEYADPTGQWEHVRDVPQSGAVLVRPDQHVAWRGDRPDADPRLLLRTALSAS